MEAKHIIKIPFEASGNSSSLDLLLCITSLSKTNTSTLPDLSIEATEGESAFTGRLYSSRLTKILSPDAGLSIQEFETVLAHVLLQRTLPATQAALQDISAIAIWGRDEGTKKSLIRLRFKREISDIRHYLGEIVLKADAEVELDVLDWTRVAVARGASAEQELKGLQMRLADAEKGVQLVREQLDELLQVKKQDEEVLMGKFVELLNEKKSRIRELESEMGRGGRPWPQIDEFVKEEEVEPVVAGRGSKARKARGAAATKDSGVSRARKRKQAEAQAEPEPAFETAQDEEEAQADEDMETDRENMEDVVDQDIATLDNEDIDMSVESDDLDAPSRSHSTGAKEKKGKSKASQSGAKAASSAKSREHKTSSKQHAFRTRKPSQPASEDDGTTDDEL